MLFVLGLFFVGGGGGVFFNYLQDFVCESKAICYSSENYTGSSVSSS